MDGVVGWRCFWKGVVIGVRGWYGWGGGVKYVFGFILILLRGSEWPAPVDGLATN